MAEHSGNEEPATAGKEELVTKIVPDGAAKFTFTCATELVALPKPLLATSR